MFNEIGDTADLAEALCLAVSDFGFIFFEQLFYRLANGEA